MAIDAAKGSALLEEVKKKYGFIPNTLRELSKNPAVLELYLQANESLTGGVLSASEQNLVMLTVSKGNECNYCQAVHKALHKKMGNDAATIQAVLENQSPPEGRDRALVDATRLVMEKRGWLTGEDLEHLEHKGIPREELYEIIAIVSVKTITNYINHIAATPIDEAFQ
ncbi:MAG: carboxymuconolactone decarboxylase family protein [Nitrospinaceae bacterium]